MSERPTAITSQDKRLMMSGAKADRASPTIARPGRLPPPLFAIAKLKERTDLDVGTVTLIRGDPVGEEDVTWFADQGTITGVWLLKGSWIDEDELCAIIATGLPQRPYAAFQLPDVYDSMRWNVAENMVQPDNWAETDDPRHP